jgi:hypothetical protein
MLNPALVRPLNLVAVVCFEDIAVRAMWHLRTDSAAPNNQQVRTDETEPDDIAIRPTWAEV